MLTQIEIKSKTSNTENLFLADSTPSSSNVLLANVLLQSNNNPNKIGLFEGSFSWRVIDPQPF